jgi:hypothetical protein
VFFDIVALSFTLIFVYSVVLAAGRVDVSFELCDHSSALQLEGANPCKVETAINSGSCLFCSSCLFFDPALELASAPALNIKTLALFRYVNIYTFQFKQTHMKSNEYTILYKHYVTM